MTDPVFGRATPVHFEMLNFACWSDPTAATTFDGWVHDPWPALEHHQKIKQIIQGRANLYFMTEQDFGVSLRKWRDYFVGCVERGEEDFGYGHAYAASVVDAAIQQVINDPTRIALEQEADKAQANISPTPEYWWPGERNQ